MYCSQCGTPIHDKSKFCYKCGARVLTVPEPEEGQGGEAEERQSSRGSEGRERRGGRSSEKDPESGADGAGGAGSAAPAVKPAPVKAPRQRHQRPGRRRARLPRGRPRQTLRCSFPMRRPQASSAISSACSPGRRSRGMTTASG